MLDEPTLSNITDPNFGRPPDQQNVVSHTCFFEVMCLLNSLLQLLQQIGHPHVSSFNYMVNKGLDQAISDLNPVEFMINNDKITLEIVEASLSCPLVPMGTVGVKSAKVFPSECRQRAATYKGRFIARVSWAINGVQQTGFEKDMGEIPIMIKVF